MNANVDYLELDLFRLLKALWKRAWVIVLACVLCASATFAYARFAITPTYQAGVMMYVNNSAFSLGSTSFSFSASELSAAQSLVDTYIIILRTRTTLNEVIREGQLDRSYGELRSMISAGSVNGTEVFQVTVTSDDPQEAAHIANTIAEVLPSKVANVVEGSSVRTVDYAVVPGIKSDPNITMYTMIGLLLGAVIACFFIILAELRDDQIHDEAFLTLTYNLPVLASVPDLGKSTSGPYGGYGSYQCADKSEGGK